MMTFLAVAGYVVIAFLLAVPFGRWAERDAISSPYGFGLLCGMFWPLTVPWVVLVQVAKGAVAVVEFMAGKRDLR